MEQLKLTAKRKKQLLQMCNTLFPMYYSIRKNYCIYSEFLLVYSNLDFSVLDSSGLCEGSYSEQIPWFEFCLLHIAPRIEKLDTNFYASTNMNQCAIEVIRNKVHPVDYLYKQFKLLK